MKVFITRATGFIGTQLVQRLARTEHELCCLVKPGSSIADIENLAATLVEGDVTDPISLLGGMRGSDSVVNLANVCSFWERDRSVYSALNIEGTRNVMECALEAGIRKVVHVSTAMVYGRPPDIPFTEESESGPLRFSECSRTRYAGDLIAWDLHERRGLPLVVLYVGDVLGADNNEPVGQHIKNVIYNRVPIRALGNAVRTYVHGNDVTEAIVRALGREDDIGERYLLGKHRLSFREYDELISEVSGISLPMLQIPDFLAVVGSHLFTWLADLTRKPPIWGISAEGLREMKAGLVFDGTKAERELGITYTPIRAALEEAIASYEEAAGQKPARRR